MFFFKFQLWVNVHVLGTPTASAMTTAGYTSRATVNTSCHKMAVKQVKNLRSGICHSFQQYKLLITGELIICNSKTVIWINTLVNKFEFIILIFRYLSLNKRGFFSNFFQVILSFYFCLHHYAFKTTFYMNKIIKIFINF